VHDIFSSLATSLNFTPRVALASDQQWGTRDSVRGASAGAGYGDGNIAGASAGYGDGDGTGYGDGAGNGANQ
jgi:hypothetical protein